MKRREDVEEILICDLIAPVEAVDSTQCFASALAVVAPLHDLGHEQRRVVVAPLRTRLELTALDEDRRCGRDAECPVERHLEGANVVPREFPADQVVNDLDVIPLGIEAGNATCDVVAAHNSALGRGECDESDSTATCSPRSPDHAP